MPHLATVPALPPRRGRWKAQTIKTWESWWTDGTASAWSLAQVAAAERLIALIEDLNRASTPRERRLIGDQVRLQERHLGVGRARRAPTADRADPRIEPERWRDEWRDRGCRSPQTDTRRPPTPIDFPPGIAGDPIAEGNYALALQGDQPWMSRARDELAALNSE